MMSVWKRNLVSQRYVWAAYAIGGVGLLVVSTIQAYVGIRAPFPWPSALQIVVITGMALVGVVSMGIAVREMTRQLRARRAHGRSERGLCVRCGYPLGGLPSSTCPECGT